MDTEQIGRGSSGAAEDGPLIDIMEDLIDLWSPIAQEPTITQLGSLPHTSGPPALIPVGSPLLSPFDNPAWFEEQESAGSGPVPPPSTGLVASASALSLLVDLELDLDRSGRTDSLNLLCDRPASPSPILPTPPASSSFFSRRWTRLKEAVKSDGHGHTREPWRVTATLLQRICRTGSTTRAIFFALALLTPAYFILTYSAFPLFANIYIAISFSLWFFKRPYAIESVTKPIPRFAPPSTPRLAPSPSPSSIPPTPHPTPPRTRSPIHYPTCSLGPSHPARLARTTAYTLISDAFLNDAHHPSTALDIIEAACQTARQAGVPTQQLLSLRIINGSSDSLITPLCLECSRVDLGGDTRLVSWLIKNTRPSQVAGEIKKGCLMRLGGMGEQKAWDTLQRLIPDGDARLGYDVDVKGLATVQGRGRLNGPEMRGERNNQEPRLSQVHRARIDMPFEGSPVPVQAHFGKLRLKANLGVNLTAEWMFAGRVWGLWIGGHICLLTLRQTSALVSAKPVKVDAVLRIFSLDLEWTGVKEVDRIGSDRLLPTQTPSDASLPGPLYECKFEGKELVPWSVKKSGESSDIRASMGPLSNLTRSRSGIKVEVVIRVADREWGVVSTSANIAD